MLNFLVNKSDELYHSSAEDSMDSILAMLRKKYPEYQNEFVLWLDFSFYTKYQFQRMDAKLEFLNENGQVILSVDTEDEKNEMGMLIRNPFPNKRISQIGCKRGRNRIYGVPLLFSTYEEMASIKTVRVTWTLYKPRYFEHQTLSQPFEMIIDQLVVNVKTNFVQPVDADHHWYVLHYQDVFYRELVESENAEDIPYQYLVGYNGTIALSDQNTLNDIHMTDCYDVSFVDDVDYDFDEILFFLKNMKWNKHVIQMMLQEIHPFSDSEVNYYRQYYGLTTDVYGKIAPDMLISSCFGFRK